MVVTFPAYLFFVANQREDFFALDLEIFGAISIAISHLLKLVRVRF